MSERVITAEERGEDKEFEWSLRPRRLGGGDRDDVKSSPNPLGEQFDKMLGGRTRTEA